MTIRTRSLLAGVALVPIVSAAFATTACAQAAARDFNIAGGPLDSALMAYARQADVQLLYPTDLAAGLRTGGVVGRHAPEAALERLLAGTGVAWSRSRPGVIVLRRGQSERLAAGEATEIDEIVVTGTLIRGPAETASPVVTLTASAIDQAGHGSIAEALQALPQNFGGSATPTTFLTASDVGGSNSTLSTGVDLRGLGPDSTLVLVDGRRLAGTGSRGEFTDVSAIPNAAVERVDVLLDGASALYGSDAVGGVVNIVLRRAFEGQESRARISAAQGGAEEVMASHVVGRRWSSGAALLSYEYRDQSALSGSDRAFTATGDLRPFGGTDRRAIFSSPGNLVVFDPVQAGYVATHAIRPTVGSVARTAADFVAGAANLSNRREGADIIPSQERHAVYGRVRQDIGERLSLSADLRFSDREFAFANLAPSEILTVTRANPHFVSPTGATVHQLAYSFINDLDPAYVEGESRSIGVTAGFDVALPKDWNLAAYAAWAEEKSHVTTPRLHYSRLYEALGLTADNPGTAYIAARDGYFNPFGSGGANAPIVTDFIFTGFSRAQNRGRVSTANALADGTLLSLPAGDLKLAIGAQVRREAFERSNETFTSGLAPSTSFITPQVRDIAAVFAEARIPLISERNARPGLQRLEVSVAARTEHYEDFGSSTNPKVGVIWSPAEALNLRASWGTSFRAPSLNELNEAVVIGATSTTENGVEKLAVIQLGGNTDLDPETAETLTVGFEYHQPQGWRINASYFDIRFEDRIGRPVAENIDNALADPNLAAFVRRVDPSIPADLAVIDALITDPRFVPPGLYPASAYSAIFDARWLNTGDLRVKGVDLGLGRGFAIGADRVDVDLSASWLLEYSRKLTPLATRDELLDVAGYPVDLRLRAGATWTRNSWSARAGLNYVDAYSDPLGPRIDRWLTADAQLRWAPDRAFGASGVEIALNVRNILDEAPPFYDSASGDGYDAGQADALGRVVSLQLTRRW
ncbi:TonB-dependent receptor [Brevundimonas sp. PAMC22021]|uniref:TonB-dependent receptor n=1 Tax=Brevundimonas sp. PAMC22021 TaxID=2861285 RepID=UPI001C637304|nr:TonB-dependent receptor [Brevundimonas sp. PAMC22021]QYF87058.1 TonB-dependent receptor [Brevundimonas sp. PAMC22021]